MELLGELIAMIKLLDKNGLVICEQFGLLATPIARIRRHASSKASTGSKMFNVLREARLLSSKRRLSWHLEMPDRRTGGSGGPALYVAPQESVRV